VAELGISAATNQAVAALLFNEMTERLRAYLRIYLLENYERIRRISFGGVQPNLSLGVIRETLVPLPPYEEQVAIANLTHQLLAVADDVDRRITGAHSRVDRSSQAALAKAFRGELIREAS
jgi:type I restriction enzyme S subunit